MRASEFEFRNRFFIVVAIYAVAFWCYRLDPVNAGEALARLLRLHGAAGLRWIFGAGAAAMVLAAGLRTWAAAYLKSDVVHDPALHSDRLVADGPYRFVRNPLYLGMVLMGAALGLYASRLGLVVLVVGLTFFSRRLIALEESKLAASGGASFLAYTSTVPRVIPALTPRLPASGRAPRWAQAFLGEGFYWAVAIGAAVFAVTLEGRTFEMVTGAALAIYFVYQIVLRLRRRQPKMS